MSFGIMACAVIQLGILQGGDMPPIEHMTGGVAATRAIMMKDCGAYCLAIVGSRLRGDRVGFERARKLVDPETDGTCSMADLVQGLSALGIEAVPMESEDRSVPPGINILHVRASKASRSEDHFIVSEQLGDGKYRFYAPPLGTRVGDAEMLEGMWSGRFVHVGSDGGGTAMTFGGVVVAGLLLGCLIAWLGARVSAGSGGRAECVGN